MNLHLQKKGDLLYYLLAQSPGCTFAADTGRIKIYYGFTADIITNAGDCSAINDSIIITHAQGAALSTAAWQNNFSDAAPPPGTTLYGNATIAGGRAVITPSGQSLKGGLSITNIDTVSPQALEVSFDFTADQPINIFGTGGADGLAWSFGDDADYTSSISDGAGSKLRVVFDAADNSLDNGNTKGIYLTFGYTANAQMGPSSPGVLAYSPDLSWKLQTDQPVQISIDQDSRLTLTYNGNVIFNQVQLPAEYAAADKSQWKHLFTAFTGGDALRQAIDNLTITYNYHNFVYGLGAGGSGNLPATWQQSDTFANLSAP